ncbi:MAG: hypothetical protein JXB49_02040 [Bacteroidales bacterium]|nr:hypothetical protein [Bacteroidales bacterium]
MKKILLSALLVTAVIASFNKCSKSDIETKEPIPLTRIDPDTITFYHSMKGWELYSWPNGSDWNYSLLPGTNRLKTYNEVTYGGYAVTGVPPLKILLSKIPEEEWVTWIGEGWLKQCWNENYYDLSLPPEKIQNQVQQYANELNLEFHIAD